MLWLSQSSPSKCGPSAPPRQPTGGQPTGGQPGPQALMAVEEEWACVPVGGLQAEERHRLQGAGGAVTRVQTSERETEVEVRSCYFESII